MSLDRPLPRWFDDAKLGIFVHWTAAAVPAYAPLCEPGFASDGNWDAFFAENPYVEWYQNSIAIPGSAAQRHHAEHYGDLPFDAFVAQFRDGLSGWQPEPWADLFAQAGARYVVFVTKHHDGFLLWPSAHPNPHKPRWHSERDVVGELAAAVRDRGMRFGTYYSGGLDWTFGGVPITDLPSLLRAIPQGDDYCTYADAHWRELVERYDPCVLWNDIGYPASADLEALFGWFYERVPDGVVNNRFDMLRQSAGQVHTDFLTPEYAEHSTVGPKWEACRGIGTSFGFNREESDDTYLSSEALVHLFVDTVALGGNLLLNVGPTASGEVPWAQAQRLLALGWWLRTNGEAIYGTQPWVRQRDTTLAGDAVRFTATDDAVYAIVLGTPATRLVELPVVVSDQASVTCLGADRALSYESASTSTKIDLGAVPATSPAIALRIGPRAAVDLPG